MNDYLKLKELAEKATKGPWGYDGSYVCPARTEDGTTYVESWRSIADCAQPENTKFIAAANPAAVLALIAENDRLSLHSHCHLLRAQTVEVERDQLKAELEKVKADRKACWEEFKVQGRQVDQLKHEIRLLTEHNEFLASSDSRLAPELRAVKDALGLDFTASVSCEVVPAIEKLRKDAECYRGLRSVEVAEIKQARINALRALMGEASQKEFAELHDLDASYLSQLLNGHRTLGEKAAANLEKKIGLPEGSLVMPGRPLTQ
jgi:hypothetical protein